MDIQIGFESFLVGLVVAGTVWLLIRGRRLSQTPEARARAAQAAAARQGVLTSLPDGWSLSEPDRERYGAGSQGVHAYGVVASGPDGRRLIAIALSEPAAYDAVAAAVNGEQVAADAWCPPVPPVDAPDVPGPTDSPLPTGWILQAVDHESYAAGGESVSTYGALAVGPGGERALAVARDKDAAVARLIDRIEGRLDVTQSWVLRLDPPPHR